MTWWQIALVLVPCTGCVLSDFVPTTDETFSAHGADHPINVLETRPQALNVRLGKATAEFSAGSSEQACLDALKDEARRVGGDALLGWESHAALPGNVSGGRGTCHADVIRWVDDVAELADRHGPSLRRRHF